MTADETEALANGLLAPADDEQSLQASSFSADERRRLAKAGHAMPDGSFPIRNVADLKNAVAAIGRAANPAAAKAWIKKRARELKAEDSLPEGWLTASAIVNVMPGEIRYEDGVAVVPVLLEGVEAGEMRFRMTAAGWEQETGAPQESNNARYAQELCPYCQGTGKQAEAMAASAGTQVLEGSTFEILDGEAPLGIQSLRVLEDSPFGQPDSITASAAGLAPEFPPAEWFRVPEANEPTALTITADGQVYGHAALWNTCHTGIPGRCTTPPKSPSGYRYFHLGATETEDGGTVSTGKITFGAGHAPLTASRAGTAAHYDNTAHAGADVVASDGRHGIWVAGALRPGLAARAVKTLKAAALSGDWRSVNGALELIGLLAVNVPGFPVPRTQALVSSVEFVEDYDEQLEAEEPVAALVAAGILLPCEPCEEAALDNLLASIMDYDEMLDELTADAALDSLLFSEDPEVVNQRPADKERRTQMLAARAVGNEPLAQALEGEPDAAFESESGKTVNVTVNIASASE